MTCGVCACDCLGVPSRRFNECAAPHKFPIHVVWKAPTFSVLLGTKAPRARCCAPWPSAFACAAPHNRHTFSMRLPARATHSLLFSLSLLLIPFTIAWRPCRSLLSSYVLSELVNGLLLPTLAALCRKVSLRRLCCTSHEHFPSLYCISVTMPSFDRITRSGAYQATLQAAPPPQHPINVAHALTAPCHRRWHPRPRQLPSQYCTAAL